MRGGRLVREWTGDIGVTLLTALAALVTVGLSQADQPSQNSASAQTRELVVGLLCCLAVLVLRRRFPAALAVGLTLAQFLGAAAYGAAAVALFSVAALRPWRVAVPIALAQTAVVCGLMALVATDRQNWVEGAVVFTLAHAVLVTAGMLRRSRRLLVESLRERARQAEEGQRLRVEEARLLERERLAREMHDVLAHRISLLAVHAGALEFSPDAPRAQRDAAGIIRRGAYEAMEDLREVIGVLRTVPEPSDPAPERPQPTLADLPSLVSEARNAGDRVELDDQVSGHLETDDQVAGRAERDGRMAGRAGLDGRMAGHAKLDGRVDGAAGSGLALAMRDGNTPASARDGAADERGAADADGPADADGAGSPANADGADGADGPTSAGGPSGAAYAGGADGAAYAG
ncbi:histidine kinase, partial [Actinomadura logoneensis]